MSRAGQVLIGFGAIGIAWGAERLGYVAVEAAAALIGILFLLCAAFDPRQP